MKRFKLTNAITVLLLLLLVATHRAHAGPTVKLTFNQKGSWIFKDPSNRSTGRLEFPDAQPLTIEVELRDPADAKRAMRDLRPAFIRTPYMPRTAASREEIAAALAAAREYLAQLPTGEKSHMHIWGKHEAAFLSMLRIFSIYGTSQDAKAIVDYCRQEHKELKLIARNYLPIVASIEARRGMLESGALKSCLSHSLPAIRGYAALLMRAYGSSAGDSVLTEALKNPKEAGVWIEDLLDAVRDNPSSAALGFAREYLEHGIQSWKKSQPKIKAGTPYYHDHVSTIRGVLSYLLLYGSNEDRVKIESLPLGPHIIDQLFPIVTNPQVLLPVVANVQNAWQTDDYFANAASALWTHDEYVRRLVLHRMHTLNYRQHLAKMPKSAPADSRRMLGISRLKVNLLPLLAFLSIPEDLKFYFGSRSYDIAMAALCWVPPKKKYYAGILNHAMTGKSFQMGQDWYAASRESSLRKLDHVPSGEFRELVKASAAPDTTKNLLIAAQQTTSGAYCPPGDKYIGRTVRRPYWFRIHNHGIAAGILNVDPTLENGKLLFRFSLDQNVYPHRTLIDLGTPLESLSIMKATRNHGKQQFKSVRLVVNGKSVPIAIEGPDKSGSFIGSAPLKSAANAYLVFEIDVLGHTAELTVDLFAARAAR